MERQKAQIGPGIVQIIVAYVIKDNEWTSPVGHLFYDAAEYDEDTEKRDLQRMLENYKRVKGVIA